MRHTCPPSTDKVITPIAFYTRLRRTNHAELALAQSLLAALSILLASQLTEFERNHVCEDGYMPSPLFW
jgi:hypothetical protein